MSGMADGQLAFERQVAAFLGSMAEEIPDDRYTAPRSMIARAHARVAATVVGAVLLLAAVGIGGAMLVHTLSSVVGRAAPYSSANGAHGSAVGSSLRPGVIGGSDAQSLWAASQSRRYLGASAPGQYTDGLPGDIAPGRQGIVAAEGRGRTAEDSRTYGRPHGDGTGGFGTSEGGKSGYSPPVFGGGSSGGLEPPGGWMPGTALGSGLDSVQPDAAPGPLPAVPPAPDGRKHAGQGHGRDESAAPIAANPGDPG